MHAANHLGRQIGYRRQRLPFLGASQPELAGRRRLAFAFAQLHKTYHSDQP